MLRTRYRIIKHPASYDTHELQMRRWWWPVWKYVTMGRLDEMRSYASDLLHPVIEYPDAARAATTREG